MAAAIASAVDDALADLGVTIRQVPIFPDQLLKAIQSENMMRKTPN